MEYAYLLAFIASFAICFLFVMAFKRSLLALGLFGIDINKPGKPKVPEAGGMLLLPGIWIAIIALVELKLINPIAYVFLFTITCFAAIGFFDDGFKVFKREHGWGKYVINRGLALLCFTIVFGYYVLPAITGACACDLYWYSVAAGVMIVIISSLANTFAGLNGWEVGSSAIVIAALAVMASFSQIYTATLFSLCLIMLGAALALLFFNKYPARIFPGDSGTLLFGAFAGCMIVFIDYWYIALCLFFPHAYDIALKIRTNRGDMSQKREKPYSWKSGKLIVPASGKLDFAKFLVKKLGPMEEGAVVRRIHRITLHNALFWTLLYILVKITAKA